jgi:hypothetical protein
MAHAFGPQLSNILPPTPEQIREIEKTIGVAEKPIKELLFAYFKLFAKSGGPKFKQYREIATMINDFEKLPRDFADKTSFYYVPSACGSIDDEIRVSPTSLERWDFSPVIMKSDSIWDEQGAISKLEEAERARANASVGRMITTVQYTWVIIMGRCPEARGLELEVCPENITLKLVDKSKASKSREFDLRIGIKITIKDKIEISK